MNKHSVALILPYFGTFPNYFPLWLKSAGANPNFTFMIFTDIDMSSYNMPANVHVYAMTLEEIRQRAAKHLDFEPVLNVPYKLCDYKPMYGLIFEDYITGYDFWGHVDPDIIWGDIGSFVTDELLNTKGRISRWGHFELYRNTEKINRFILHKLPGWNISYRDVYRTSRIKGLDEIGLTARLFNNFTDGGGGYYAVEFAGIATGYKQFICSGRTVSAFRWNKGKLYGLAIEGCPERNIEYMYAHVQSRAMRFNASLLEKDSFMFVPNEFTEDHELTYEEIQASLTPDPEYERMRLPAKRNSFLRRVWKFIRVTRAEKILYLKEIYNRRFRSLKNYLISSEYIGQL